MWVGGGGRKRTFPANPLGHFLREKERIMFRQSTRACIVSMTVLFVGISFASAVTIETVPVGNPGNAPDTRYTTPGNGAVGYSYWMGKYEITAGQYCEFLNAVAASDRYELYDERMTTLEGCRIIRDGTDGNYRYTIAQDYKNRPVNYVSYGEAVRFCNWLHNGKPTGEQNLTTTEDGSYYINGATHEAFLTVFRKPNASYVIPNIDEWYKAAYHKNDGVTGNYWDYPTRTNRLPSNDVFDPDHGNNANYCDAWPDGYSIGYPYYRTEVGEFENSASPYGTFDQGGNVWEWNEFHGGSYGVLSGGAYSNGWSVENLHVSYSRTADAIWEKNYCSGFRIAYLPEPGCLSLLGIGVSLACRRRRNIEEAIST